MESLELELISRLSTENEELRHLYHRHRGYEAELSKLEGVRFPTESERRRINTLKREKLLGKDRIRRILADAQ